jgi:hypothetical protein
MTTHSTRIRARADELYRANHTHSQSLYQSRDGLIDALLEWVDESSPRECQPEDSILETKPRPDVEPVGEHFRDTTTEERIEALWLTLSVRERIDCWYRLDCLTHGETNKLLLSERDTALATVEAYREANQRLLEANQGYATKVRELEAKVAEREDYEGQGDDVERLRQCPCKHEAWENIGGGRSCSDCKEWLPPLEPTTASAPAGGPRDDEADELVRVVQERDTAVATVEAYREANQRLLEDLYRASFEHWNGAAHELAAKLYAVGTELQQLYTAFAPGSVKNPREAKQHIENLREGGKDEALAQLAKELADSNAERDALLIDAHEHAKRLDEANARYLDSSAELERVKGELADVTGALRHVGRIVRRTLACGQLEKLEDARRHLLDDDEPTAVSAPAAREILSWPLRPDEVINTPAKPISDPPAPAAAVEIRDDK